MISAMAIGDGAMVKFKNILRAMSMSKMEMPSLQSRRSRQIHLLRRAFEPMVRCYNCRRGCCGAFKYAIMRHLSLKCSFLYFFDYIGKVEFKYGSVEARIKLPNLANGLWPAFWLLGSSFYKGTGWPFCGEIDILEA